MSIPNQQQHFVTLLKNQWLELRQIKNGFEIGHAFSLSANDVSSSAWSIPSHKAQHSTAIFDNLSAAIFSSHAHQRFCALKQKGNGSLFREIITGRSFYEVPRHPRDVRRDRKMARGERCRGRLGSGDAVQM